MLIITGSDQADDFTIKSIAGGAITLTGNNGTLIDGSPSENTLPVTSVKMILKGGDDVVTADATSALNVAGALIIDGGDGNNSINLTTTNSPITLGAFSYIGGEGTDNITLGQSSIASSINGDLSINTGNGGSSVAVNNFIVGGELVDVGGTSVDTLSLDTVTVGKNLTFNGGLGDGTLNVNKTSVNGGLSSTIAKGILGTTLADTTVKGKSGIIVSNADGDANLSTVFTVNSTTGNVSVLGKNGLSSLNVNGGAFSVGGDLRVSNKTVSSVNSGTLGASNLTFAANDLLSAVGVGVWNVRKNLSLSALSPIGRINTASFDQLSLGGTLTSLSTLDQTVQVNKGSINGIVVLSSSRGSATLQHQSTGDFDFKKAISVGSNQAATVSFDSTGQVKVAGDVNVTSYRNSANFNNTAGSMILAGGLKVNGYVNAGLTLTSSNATGGTIAKDAIVTGLYGAVNVNAGAVNFTLSGKLTATGGTDAQLGGSSTGTVRFLKDANISGGYGDATVAFAGNGNTVFGGKLSVTGFDNATLNLGQAGASSSFTGDISIMASYGNANAYLTGSGKTFAGNFLVKGVSTNLNVNAGSGMHTFSKKLTVLGGNGNDTILMLGSYQVLGDANFNLGDGGSAVIMTGTTGSTEFVGNLNISGGESADTVTFTNVHTGKGVAVNTFGGNDVLYVDGGTVFGGAVTADMGVGDDTLDIGQGTGLSVPAATFTGKATIKAGSGNDTLFLGKSAGDGNSRAVFSTAGSSISGGNGLNTYDSAAGQGLSTVNLTISGF